MSDRRAGVLLPLAALPGRGSIGDMGPGARRFLDFLEEGRQRIWQLLPLGPTTAAGGNSPYSSQSAFAIDPLLISLEDLARDGLLREADLPPAARGGRAIRYDRARAEKAPLLRKAATAFRRRGRKAKQELEAFQEREAFWLEGDGAVLQLLAQRQWDSLRTEAEARDIQLVGDMPLYVALDSDDVRAHPSLFALRPDGTPDTIAGVPPDYFSETGQLWSNPVYRWAAHREDGYRWWRERLDRALRLFDRVRLDHFRGIQAYWAVPSGAASATEGYWVAGPGRRLLEALGEGRDGLPIVAEDLGVIDASVTALRKRFDLPGMRVLQFAFGEDAARSVHAPHNLEPNAMLFTGTHDNNTTRGWYEDETDAATRRRLHAYVGRRVTGIGVADAMIRLAYASVARDVVIPLQDVLGLGAATRTNTPGTASGNWRWRAGARMLGRTSAAKLRMLAETYARA